MLKERGRNIRLGIFVIAGLAFFVWGIYQIGHLQNKFGNHFLIHVVFKNVNGLQRGGNVRFVGIDVGTVKEIVIENDTSVRVDLVLENSIRDFVKKDAQAQINTDGLMGNKVVNITPGVLGMTTVEEGDYILAAKVVGTDDMMKTLNTTNENASTITENLSDVTSRIRKGEGVLGALVMDPAMQKDLRDALRQIRETTDRTAAISNELDNYVQTLRGSKGTLYLLFSDTTLPQTIRQTLANLKRTSDNTVLVSENLEKLAAELKGNIQPFSELLADTSFSGDIRSSMSDIRESSANIRQGSRKFDEVMEAAKHNILFRKYFKNLEKEKKKAETTPK